MSKVEVKENLLHGSGQINQTPEVEFHPTESQDQVTEDDGPDYSVDHLSAVVRPVALTMILSSLTVAKIRDPNTDSALGNGLSVYLVYNEGTNANQSSGEILGQAAINALVIVSVICAATFVLVGCYYFRCLKLMLAYLVFACINLLGFSGGFLVYSALLVYRVPIDLITLGILMYNFAVGGAIAVFWQKGIPRFITQGYLIATSVIMAWLLTKLPEWTTWSLLVALALYDLCAVLTPCGPLKALVNLAQERQDPIPGLLYEANVGSSSDNQPHDTFTSGAGRNAQEKKLKDAAFKEFIDSDSKETKLLSAEVPLVNPGEKLVSDEKVVVVSSHPPLLRHISDPTKSNRPPILAQTGAQFRKSTGTLDVGVSELNSSNADAFSSEIGSIMKAVDPEGTLIEEENKQANLVVRRDQLTEDGEADLLDRIMGEGTPDEDRSIKLGLGDFVFYSVLVSRAALYDMSTFAACFVSVLLGLGGTLFLLGVFKKALPALPISIFLGVLFYFLTRIVITPMIVELTFAGVGI